MKTKQRIEKAETLKIEKGDVAAIPVVSVRCFLTELEKETNEILEKQDN